MFLQNITPETILTIKLTFCTIKLTFSPVKADACN